MGNLAKIRQKIFAIKKDETYKFVTFLGLTFKIKRKNKKFHKETEKARLIQNTYDLEPVRSARRLIVFLIPFHDKMPYSLSPILSLCQLTREVMKDCHCLLATMPGHFTYAVSEHQDDELIYRWEQIMENCSQTEALYLHLTEPCAPDFYRELLDHEIRLLRSLPSLHLNILHLHDHLMPQLEYLKDWPSLTDNITLSTGVPEYATQENCDRAGLPLYPIPSFLVRITRAPQRDFAAKRKVILYSWEHHPMKERILQYLRENLPDYELRELHCSPREDFLNALAEARFCLNFGRDIDNYYIQPYFAQSIGLTVYNEFICGDAAFQSLPFVYETCHQMVGKLADDINRVCRIRGEYENVSARAREYFERRAKRLEGQVEALEAFYRSEPALIPREKKYVKKEQFSPDDYSVAVTHADSPPAGAEPLLTAIVFTYNHRSSIGRCLESLVNQTTGYRYEIHVWDDCSIDGTSDICVRYARKHPDKIKLVVQKENTFTKPDLELQSYAAIRQVASKYFCYIDGDDCWCDENKVQIALDFLENHPEYVGFAHDTLQIDQGASTCLSYVHEVNGYKVENPVTLSAEAPFFLSSSRVFRNSDFVKLKILPIDYKQYYYHLAQGPIYYYDKIMACYVVGENNTFANLGLTIRDLNSMFPHKLARMFNFQQDDFCTALLKKYDTTNLISDQRYNRLGRYKKIFGVRLGWAIWFFVTFVPKFGPACLSENYVYSRRLVKKRADRRVS